MGKKQTVSLQEHNAALREADQCMTETLARVMEKRLDGMNEFRGSLEDQARRMITRPEHDALIVQIGQRFDTLTARMNEEFASLNEYKAQSQGGASSHQVSTVQNIAIAGIAVSIIGNGVTFIGVLVALAALAVHLLLGK